MTIYVLTKTRTTIKKENNEVLFHVQSTNAFIDKNEALELFERNKEMLNDSISWGKEDYDDEVVSIKETEEKTCVITLSIRGATL